jgi:hypothetical protein
MLEKTSLILSFDSWASLEFAKPEKYRWAVSAVTSDESSDQQQQEVFCVAAFLANETYWRPLEVRWVNRLHEDHIEYFRASDCKAVRGAFNHLRKKHGSFLKAQEVADKLRADLENILLTPPSPWIGFAAGVVISDYDAVRQVFPEARYFFGEDKTVPAYRQVMYEVARTVRRKAKEFGIAYIVDDSTYSQEIKQAFDATKNNHPTVAASMKTIAALDDKATPALQIADLFANVCKDIFLDWLRGGAQHPEFGKWHDHIDRMGKFDKGVMLHSLLKTLNSPRLAKGTLARQFIPEHRITKSKRKQMRRKLTKEPVA